MSIHRVLGVLAGTCRALSRILNHGGIVIVIAIALSPIGPHLRANVSFEGTQSNPRFTECVYLGSRGYVNPHIEPNCPFIALIDTRDWR